MINRAYEIGMEKSYYSLKDVRINSQLGNMQTFSVTVCFLHILYLNIFYINQNSDLQPGNKYQNTFLSFVKIYIKAMFS